MSQRRRCAVRASIAFTGVAAAALSMTSCSTPSDGTNAEADTLRIVLPEEPPTLEACDSSLTSTGVVVRSNITEPMVERNPSTGDLQPKLAESWKQTSPTEWTFALREGVQFSDGTPLTAKAVTHSINRALNPSISCAVAGYVFGDAKLTTTAVDDTTLTVATEAPDPILPLKLSFIEVVPADTNDTEKVRQPIGTGPYRIDQWDPGQRIRLARNDNYWDDAPAYANVDYLWRSEGSIRAAMVQAGEAEIATALSPEDIQGELAVVYPNNETTAIRSTGTYAPLDDIRVRQAINYAVDREGISNGLLRGFSEPAAQLVPDGVVGFDPDLNPWPYDPDQAQRLIGEARADGVPVDTQIRLIARTGQFPKIAEITQVIQKSLQDIGLNVEIEMMDTANQLPYQQRPFPADTGPYIVVVQHGNQAGDAEFSVSQYILSDGAQSTFGTPDMDERYDKARTLQGQERQNGFAEIFATEPLEIAQLAYIAHMSGLLAKAPSVSYTPNSATGDEMRLADFTPTA